MGRECTFFLLLVFYCFQRPLLSSFASNNDVLNHFIAFCVHLGIFSVFLCAATGPCYHGDLSAELLVL